MHQITKLALWLSTAAALAACQHSVSGSYVGHSNGSATLLQLTETPDQHLTGTLQTATLREDGSLNKQSANVSGAVDGDNVTISIQAGVFSVARNVSGTFVGTGLDVVLPAEGSSLATHLLLAKEDVSQFESAANDLAVRGNATIAQRQQEQQKKAAELASQQKVARMDSELSRLSVDLHEFSSAAQTRIIGRVDHAEQAYAGAVSRGRDLLQKERGFLVMGSVSAHSQAVAAHGYLIGLFNDAGVEDSRISDTENRLREIITALNERLASAERLCAGAQKSDPSFPAPHSASCQEFERAATSYRTLLPKVAAAMASVDAAKTHGDADLADIMREADSMLK